LDGTGAGTRDALDLGAFPLEEDGATAPVRVDEALAPSVDEAIRRALERLEKSGGLPRLLFVAAGEDRRGAARLAAGFARAASARGMETLLLDASVDAPVLDKPFPYQPEEGLVDMVLWGSSLHAVLRKTRDERIRLVNTGSPAPVPDTLFDEPECDAVLNTLRGEAELVVVVGAIRGTGGGLSPLLRKADRCVVVRASAEEDPDLGDEIPADRIASVRLVVAGAPPAEAAKEDRDETPVPRQTDARRVPPKEKVEKKGLPLVPLVLLFVALSIFAGVVTSRFYLSRNDGPAVGRETVAQNTDEAAELDAVRSAPEGEGMTPATAGRDIAPTTAGGAAAGASAVLADGEGSTEETASEAPVANGSDTELPDAEAPVVATTEEREAPPARSTEPPPATVTVPAAVRPATGPYYGIHVESFPETGQAERSAMRYEDAGEPIAIVAKAIEGKGTWYRVVVGRYATVAEAEAEVETMKEAFGLSYALVVRVTP